MDDLKPINLDTSTASTTPSLNNNQEINPMDSKPKSNMFISVAVAIGVIGGLLVGYQFAKNKLLLATGTSPLSTKMAQNPESADSVAVGDIFGAADEKTFRDQAEGVLQPGGIEGEGSHHIERGSNASQWVYITSSVVDLDLFIGHQVTVWGETNAGKKAGWLMDVGRLKVQQLNAAEINNIEAPLSE